MQGSAEADAVLRSLRDKAHIEGLRPRQLYVFGRPGRDTRGWVISVAHLDAYRPGLVGKPAKLFRHATT